MHHALLATLNDCEFHSGEHLAQQLGVTRAAVWKHLKSLREDFGIEVHAVTGRGYRLVRPVELLDKSLIQRSVRQQVEDMQVETFLNIDSTNRYLLETISTHVSPPRVVLAEHQTAGRGRRGREWISPFGGNLYMSLLYRIEQPGQGLMGLSLAVAVAIGRVLKEKFHTDVQLKWPNDILVEGKKLCGILLELQGENPGPVDVVVGVGLNVSLSDQVRKQIDQPCVALSDCTNTPVSRNQLAVDIICDIYSALQTFEESGLTSFLSDWQSWDCYNEKPVRLYLGNRIIEGQCRGIDEQGALLVEEQGQVRRFYSGEISLRTVN